MPPSVYVEDILVKIPSESVQASPSEIFMSLFRNRLSFVILVNGDQKPVAYLDSAEFLRNFHFGREEERGFGEISIKKKFVSVRKNIKIVDALPFFKKAETNFLVVVNEHEHYEGIVYLTDLVKVSFQEELAKLESD